MTTCTDQMNALTDADNLHRETASELLMFADTDGGMPLRMLLGAWGATRIGVPLTVLLAHRVVDVTGGIVTVTNPAVDLDELVFTRGDGSG